MWAAADFPSSSGRRRPSQFQRERSRGPHERFHGSYHLFDQDSSKSAAEPPCQRELNVLDCTAIFWGNANSGVGWSVSSKREAALAIDDDDMLASLDMAHDQVCSDRI